MSDVIMRYLHIFDLGKLNHSLSLSYSTMLNCCIFICWNIYFYQATGENPTLIPGGASSYAFKRSEAGSDTSYMDSTVPFPRTCGARFCSVGGKGDFQFNFAIQREKICESLIWGSREFRKFCGI